MSCYLILDVGPPFGFSRAPPRTLGCRDSSDYSARQFEYKPTKIERKTRRCRSSVCATLLQLLFCLIPGGFFIFCAKKKVEMSRGKMSIDVEWRSSSPEKKKIDKSQFFLLYGSNSGDKRSFYVATPFSSCKRVSRTHRDRHLSVVAVVDAGGKPVK